MESSPPADCPVGGGGRPNLGNRGLTHMGEILSYDCGWVSYDFAILSYGFWVLSYGLRFLSYESIFSPTLIERKVHWNGKQSASGLPSGRQTCRPNLGNRGLTHMGEILSYDCGRLSYDFAFLSYVFSTLSYGFRFLSYESTFPPILIERKVH